jgi:hypothetical protein
LRIHEQIQTARERKGHRDDVLGDDRAGDPLHVGDQNISFFDRGHRHAVFHAGRDHLDPLNGFRRRQQLGVAYADGRVDARERRFRVRRAGGDEFDVWGGGLQHRAHLRGKAAHENSLRFAPAFALLDRRLCLFQAVMLDHAGRGAVRRVDIDRCQRDGTCANRQRNTQHAVLHPGNLR